MATKRKTSKTFTSGEYPRLDFSLMPPYAKQLEVMEFDARFKVVAFGRQSGKSWMARRMLLDAAANEGKKCWWVFPVYKAAETHWMELLALLERTGFPVKDINKTAMRIEFWSGGYIIIRSADVPDNLRGPSLDLIVMDEAAFMGEDIWSKILQPMLTATRGRALIISTPNGRNWFYQYWLYGRDERYTLYQSWQMKSEDSPYQDKEALDDIKRTTHPLVWREEYEAEFLADGGGVFNGVEKAAIAVAILKPIAQTLIRRYVMGIDWADDGDYTAVCVIDKLTRTQVYGERFQSFGTTGTIERIIELLYLWEPDNTFIERNGVGEPLFKLLKERLTGYSFYEDEADLWTEGNSDIQDNTGVFGGFRLTGVFMDNNRKRNVVERAAVDIEWGRLFLLAETQDDLQVDAYSKQQISEMSTFERTRTKSGNLVTYKAAEGNHDDTVIALCLAYMGVPKPERFRKHWEISKPIAGKKNPFRNRR